MSNGVILPAATPNPATTDWVPIGPPGPGVPPAGTQGQALIKNTNSDYDTKWGNAGADLIYDGDYAGSTAYKDGEIVVYQGVAYICTMPTSSPPSAWPGGAAVTQPPATVTGYGTTLPASPYDGQEYVLVDNTTNPTYQWRFRYNAGSTSTYKWEFVGGMPYWSGPQGSLSNFSGANNPADITGGPTVTVPRAGIYQFSYGVFMQNNGTFAAVYVVNAALYVGGTAVTTTIRMLPTSAYGGGAMAGFGRATIGAGAAVNMKVYNDRTGSQSTADTAWIQTVPERVS